jgi:hypothetical protein
MKVIENSCQPFTKNHSVSWLLLTFATSPSKNTIQIAIDGNFEHPHSL